MQRGLEGDCDGCDGYGAEDRAKGDEAGGALDVVPTAAPVVEEVRLVTLPTIAQPVPTGENDALLTCFDGLHHVEEQFEAFFRGGGGVELFPVHSWNICATIPKNGLGKRKRFAMLNNIVNTNFKRAVGWLRELKFKIANRAKFGAARGLVGVEGDGGSFEDYVAGIRVLNAKGENAIKSTFVCKGNGRDKPDMVWIEIDPEALKAVDKIT